MLITDIEVEGYRLLDDFSADLRPLTVVIGANAVGKSTLIDCLQMISECTQIPLNTAVGWRWGSASLRTAREGEGTLTWRVTVQKPTNSIWRSVPLEENRSLVYEVVLESDPQGQVRPKYEVLRNPKPAPGYTEPYKFLEATPYRRMILNRKRELVPFDEAQPSTVAEEADADGSADRGGLPGSAQEDVSLMLSQIRFFNDFPIPSAIRVLLQSMAFYPGFDVTRASRLRTQPADIKPTATLSKDGVNLGTVLHEILTRYDYRERADELRDFLRVAYPAFEEIHCDTTFGTSPQVLVRVRERGMPRSMELWELSDGMLRFLCLATALLSPSSPMVAIDEPELGLHPRLLPIVGDMVKAAAERTQVIATTHSPDLLSRFDIQDIAVMTREPEEPKVMWHRPADRETLSLMLKEVAGENLGDLFRSGELEAGA